MSLQLPDRIINPPDPCVLSVQRVSGGFLLVSPPLCRSLFRLDHTTTLPFIFFCMPTQLHQSFNAKVALRFAPNPSVTIPLLSVCSLHELQPVGSLETKVFRLDRVLFAHPPILPPRDPRPVDTWGSIGSIGLLIPSPTSWIPFASIVYATLEPVCPIFSVVPPPSPLCIARNLCHITQLRDRSRSVSSSVQAVDAPARLTSQSPTFTFGRCPFLLLHLPFLQLSRSDGS